MAPDRRALFEAAYGALMIRNAPSQPARRPVPPTGADQSSNTLPATSLADGVEPAPRTRS
jgi:hypothetical protein